MRSETSEHNEAKIAEAIVGKQIKALERATFNRGGKLDPLRPHGTLLKVRDLALPGKLKAINLDIKAGEVIGVAGLLGSGRSELLHCIFGAYSNYSSHSRAKLCRNRHAAVKAGVALVPEDRFQQGLVPEFEIWRNATLPDLERVSFFNFLLDRKREVEAGEESIRRLSIKAHSPHIAVNKLSGGNAQKVTISKWLFSDVKVFLLDEPTAGIDIGAKTTSLCWFANWRTPANP